MSTIDMVREFHKRHSCDRDRLEPAANEVIEAFAESMEQIADELKDHAKGEPRLVRMQLIQEELAELARAMVDMDRVRMLDAVCDLRYVCDGAILQLDFDGIFEDAFDEVHRSNMTKDAGKDASGRVVKGPSYSPPDLARVLESR